MRHLAPPVPAAPPPYIEPAGLAAPERPVTPPAREPAAARLPRTPPGRSPHRNATASGATVPLIFPSPEKPTRRRRSVSLSSLERRESRTTSSTSGDSPVSTRSRPGRSEDERLKRELRKWKIAIEGVMDDDLFTSSHATEGIELRTERESPVLSGARSLSPAFDTESLAQAGSAQPPKSSTTASTSRTETPEIRLHSPSATPVSRPSRTSRPSSPRTASPERAAEPSIASVDTTPQRTQRADSASGDGQDSPSDLSLREFLARADRSPPTPAVPLADNPRIDHAPDHSFEEPGRGEREVLLLAPGRESPLPYTPRPQSRAAKSAGGRETFADLDDEALDAKAQEIAQQIFDGDESFVDSRKAAEWLGSSTRISGAALRHYLQKFDFAGLRLDGAFRWVYRRNGLLRDTQLTAVSRTDGSATSCTSRLKLSRSIGSSSSSVCATSRRTHRHRSRVQVSLHLTRLQLA